VEVGVAVGVGSGELSSIGVMATSRRDRLAGRVSPRPRLSGRSRILPGDLPGVNGNA
jgi:hypothetical protein